MTIITVSPAYGRDYTSAKAALAHWTEGKDFILHDVFSPWNGKPCSIRDFPAGTTVNIRYQRMRRVAVTSVGDQS